MNEEQNCKWLPALESAGLITERETRLRQEILICMKANGIRVTGEVWLTLVFMDEAALAAIARELHINTK